MSSKYKNYLLFTIKLSVAFGLLYYLVQKGDLDLKSLLQAPKPVFLLLAFFVALLNILVNTYRWTLLLWYKDFKCKFSETVQLSMMGYFFNFVLPSSVGGDAVKAYYLAKSNPEKKMLSVTSVLVDRIYGLYGMVMIALVTMLVNYNIVSQSPQLMQILMFSVVIIICMNIAFLMLFSKTVKELSIVKKILGIMPGFLMRVYEALNSYGNLKLFSKAVCLSIISQSMAVLFMILVGQALDQTLPIATYFFAIPVGFIVMSVPISVGGLGIGQVAFMVLFKMYSGIDTQVGQLGITAFQGMLLIWGFLGLLSFARGHKKVLQEVTS